MERVRLTAFPTVFSLFFNTVFILLVLALANRRLCPRWALAPAELLKTAIIKYGGRLTYRRATALFLGFILADFVIISLMNLVSLALHIPCLRFLD